MTKLLVTLDRLERYPWGMNMFEILGTDCIGMLRLNIARWSEEQIRGATNVIRKLDGGMPILFDLGQKLRMQIPQGNIVVSKGAIWEVSLRPDSECLSFNYDISNCDIPLHHTVIMHDGRITGVVLGRDDDCISIQIMEVKEWDTTLDKLFGVYFPGLEMRFSWFGEREIRALKLASELRIPAIAFSFVETPDDVCRAGMALPKHYFPRQILKVETQKGVENIEDIVCGLPEGAMIMIGRGDLFIRAPYMHLAYYQRRIVETCRKHNIPFIVATGFLTSMCCDSVPARAEVVDVDTAVRSGADYIMLSEETTRLSKHPIEAIKTLHEICSLAASG